MLLYNYCMCYQVKAQLVSCIILFKYIGQIKKMEKQVSDNREAVTNQIIGYQYASFDDIKPQVNLTIRLVITNEEMPTQYEVFTFQQLKNQRKISEEEQQQVSKQFSEVNFKLQTEKYWRLAKQMMFANRTEEAIDCLKKMINLKNSLQQKYLNFGCYQDRQSQINKLKQVLYEILNRHPLPVQSLLFLGIFQFLQKNSEKAIELYQMIIEINPTYPLVYNNLGLIFYNKLQFQKALQYYKQAQSFGLKEGVFLWNVGNAYYAMKQIDQAQKYYREAIKMKPNCADAYAYSSLGKLLYDKKDLQQAEYCLKKAIQLNPKCETAYYAIGQIMQDHKRFPEAIDSYKKATEVSPTYFQAFNKIAYIYGMCLDNFNQAMFYYKQSIRIEPRSFKSYNGIGNLLNKISRHEQSIEYYQKALQISPNQYIVLNNLGQTYRLMGLYQQAFQKLKQALKIKPNCHLLYSKLGILFYQKKQYALAVKCYEQTAKLEGEYYDNINSNLGISYGRLGNLKAAVHFLINAIYNNPEDTQSLRFLAQITHQSFNFSDFYSAYVYLIHYTNSQKQYYLNYYQVNKFKQLLFQQFSQPVRQYFKTNAFNFEKNEILKRYYCGLFVEHMRVQPQIESIFQFKDIFFTMNIISIHKSLGNIKFQESDVEEWMHNLDDDHHHSALSLFLASVYFYKSNFYFSQKITVRLSNILASMSRVTQQKALILIIKENCINLSQQYKELPLQELHLSIFNFEASITKQLDPIFFNMLNVYLCCKLPIFSTKFLLACIQQYPQLERNIYLKYAWKFVIQQLKKNNSACHDLLQIANIIIEQTQEDFTENFQHQLNEVKQNLKYNLIRRLNRLLSRQSQQLQIKDQKNIFQNQRKKRKRLKVNNKFKIPQNKNRRVFEYINTLDYDEYYGILQTQEIILLMQLKLSSQNLEKRTKKQTILSDVKYGEILNYKYSKTRRFNNRLAVNITQTFLSVSDRTQRLAYNEILTNMMFGDEFANKDLNLFTTPFPNEVKETYYDFFYDKMSTFKALIAENPLGQLALKSTMEVLSNLKNEYKEQLLQFDPYGVFSFSFQDSQIQPKQYQPSSKEVSQIQSEENSKSKYECDPQNQSCESSMGSQFNNNYNILKTQSRSYSHPSAYHYKHKKKDEAFDILQSLPIIAKQLLFNNHAYLVEYLSQTRESYQWIAPHFFESKHARKIGNNFKYFELKMKKGQTHFKMDSSNSFNQGAKDLLKWLTCLIRGIVQLQKAGIFHEDLQNLQNILRFKDPQNEGQYCYKIIDFDWAFKVASCNGETKLDSNLKELLRVLLQSEEDLFGEIVHRLFRDISIAEGSDVYSKITDIRKSKEALDQRIGKVVTLMRQWMLIHHKKQLCLLLKSSAQKMPLSCLSQKINGVPFQNILSQFASKSQSVSVTNLKQNENDYYSLLSLVEAQLSIPILGQLGE